MMNLLDLALGSLYSRGPRGQGGQRDPRGTGRPGARQLRPRLPVYSGTDAGDEALLPFSQSRSRLPGRRLGDMRPDGDGALWGDRRGQGGGHWQGKPPQRQRDLGEMGPGPCRVGDVHIRVYTLAVRHLVPLGHTGMFLRPGRSPPCTHALDCALSSLQWKTHGPRGHPPASTKLTETWTSSRQGYGGPRWPQSIVTGWTESRLC